MATFSSWCDDDFQIIGNLTWNSYDDKVVYSLTVTAHSVYATTNGNARVQVIVDGNMPVDGWGSMTAGSNTTLATTSWTKNRTHSSQTCGITVKVWLPYSQYNLYKNGTTAYYTDTMGAKTSYTVSYNANNGSGAPSSQTKWYGETLQLSATKPIRTGWNFVNWYTNAAGTGTAYTPSSNYTTNAALTLYAKWSQITYTVTYDVGQGSNKPANQTKYYGTNLALSSTIPTRTNYKFKGWATSSGSSTVVYAAGATYTGNAALNLYAVWELSYLPPTITGLQFYRCGSDGAADDNGTYYHLKLNWAITSPPGDDTLKSITLTPTSGSAITIQGATNARSGAVDSISPSGSYTNETTYYFTLTVTTSKDLTYTQTVTLTAATFYLDFAPNGSMGIGGVIGQIVAKTKNLWLDIAYKVHAFYDFYVEGVTELRGGLNVKGDITALNAADKYTGGARSLYIRQSNPKPTADTGAGWGTIGDGAYWYDTASVFATQPSQWGFLLSLGASLNSVERMQFFKAQANGELYFRGMNGSSTTDGGTAWRKVLDTSNTSDYVVAQGTSGIWRYVKYNSGIAMCWGIYKSSGNQSISSAWGNLLEGSSAQTTPNYPFSFTEIPTSVIEYLYADTNAQGAAFVERSPSTISKTTAGSFYLVRPGSAQMTIGHPTVSIFAVGRWK